MTLRDLTQTLECYDPETRVPFGLGNPHSWRGSYDEIAFEIVENTTVGEMLQTARAVEGQVMEGYKGGEYRMTLDTAVNIDDGGCYSGGQAIWGLLLKLMCDSAAPRPEIP